MNDTEKHRNGINIYNTEQAIWEIYPKPFEIAIKKRKADIHHVFFDKNRTNVVWSQCRSFR